MKTTTTSAHIGKFAVLFLLSGFWLLTAINSAYDIFYYDRFLIFSWVGLIWVFQFLFLLIIIKIKLSEWACNMFFAIFAVINLFCLYLFFIAAVAALPTSIQVVLFAFSLFVAHQFFASLSGDGRWTKGVIGIVGILFSVNITGFIFPDYLFIGDSLTHEEHTKSLEKIKIVSFRQKPNMYFISFDALLPASLAKKFLKIDNFPPHHFILKNGFRRFENAFSESSLTHPSLNRMLAMDPDYYQSLAEQGKHFGLFIGLSPSPVFEIFKANDYTTNTYFRDQYMGRQVGPYVNNHKVVDRLYYFIFCRNHPVANVPIFGFFGYCLFSENEQIWNFFHYLGVATESVYERLTIFQYVDFVLKDFARQLSIGKPFVAFAHILSPNHTPIPFFRHQFDGYRKQVLQTLGDETPRLMEKVFNFIRINDPNAFIYFYSDHGQWLSRWISNAEFQGLSKAYKEFYIQDRYGILAAFYPADVCAEYFDSPIMKPFVTNSMVIRQIIRCLADGDDPVTTPLQYRIWQDKDGYPGDEPGYYEDYLYE